MKESFSFRLLWAAAWLFGRMPRWFRYGVSDVLSFLLYRVVRYRRTVVADNIARSFPDKSPGERLRIERRFYRHLGDVFVETVSLVSMTESRLRRYMVYENREVVDSASCGRPMIAAMSHYGQWEYTIGYSLFTDHPVKAVYHPLSSPMAEMFYKKMRSRFGTEPVTMKAVTRSVMREIAAGRHPIVALIADQTPPIMGVKNFIRFLSQPTAFFIGMERMALGFGMSVVFMAIRRTPKRGYYTVRFTQIYDGVEQVPPDTITRRYATALEELIRENPEYWIWSHKRWKHHPDAERPYIDEEE
ncbi:MAG: lysophospholipid acyltransferase family protein [Rikenellaceae bacterium]|nr:lysophospholipid acyltransferase family protein [Rikenellaceae bacterium]